MIDPLSDARLRDDIAQQIFTQAMSVAQCLGNVSAAERKALLDDVAAISFEVAEAFVQARKAFNQNRRT